MLLARPQVFGEAAHFLAVVPGQIRGRLQQRLQRRLEPFAGIDFAGEVTDRILVQIGQPLELQRVQTATAILDMRQGGPRQLQALRHIQLREHPIPVHPAQTRAKSKPMA